MIFRDSGSYMTIGEIGDGWPGWQGSRVVEIDAVLGEGWEVWYTDDEAREEVRRRCWPTTEVVEDGMVRVAA